MSETSHRTEAAPTVHDQMARSRTSSIDIEEALLDAARRLLRDEGVNALSVRRIATEAGVAPMGVYSRFGDKNGIVDRLLIESFEQLDHAMHDAVVPDGVECVRRGMRRYRQFALDDPHRYSLLFDKAIPDYEPSPCALERAAESFGVLVDAVARAIASGDFAGTDATEIAQRFWAAAHGAVSLEVRDIGFVSDYAAHFDTLVETLVAGLAPKPRRKA
jgi:AcrR family transcriptional regulator